MPDRTTTMPQRTTPRQGAGTDPMILGLMALGWALEDAARADRLLALTGLTPEGLRANAADPVTLGAVIGFLEGHEADLIACSDALGVPPETLVAAGRSLA